MNYRGTGSAQYPPQMLPALLIYCYSQGLFSSRRIERATWHNVAVRYITGPTHPDHDTICTLRRRNARRKHTAEPVFGIIKDAMGLRQFLLRGLQNVTLEWELVCTAYNLKRPWALRGG